MQGLDRPTGRTMIRTLKGDTNLIVETAPVIAAMALRILSAMLCSASALTSYKASKECLHSSLASRRRKLICFNI